MLRAARELLAVRSPLDAELMVSELLGTWWGERAPRPQAGADLDELIGEGLVAYAAHHKSPAALALLSGIACLGTPRQAAQAEQAALALIEHGIPRPGWAASVGAVTPGECHVSSGFYGDRDEVACVFSYGGAEPHALVMAVDYNFRGMLCDGWVTSQVETLMKRCRPRAGQAPARGGFREISQPEARHLLESALAETDRGSGVPVAKSFPAYHAFIRSRIRALPRASGGLLGAARSTAVAATGRADAAGPGPGWTGVAVRQRSWSVDRRAMLVAEFLAADEAEGLSDRKAASRCSDHIISYGCDQDFGRPLRMSPAKAETFLIDWLPRKVMLTAAEQHTMPHVLAAWAQWAGRREGVPEHGIRETLDAVFAAMGTFSQVYRDPASYGLDEGLIARLLPDADLEALPRRAFAFPVLEGRHGGIDLSTLDPAEPRDRRLLLAAGHSDTAGRGTSEQHLQRHLVLSDHLWRGDPPELWEAAQRMLDRGEDRHAVQHTLMYVIRDAGDDPAQLARELARIP